MSRAGVADAHKVKERLDSAVFSAGSMESEKYHVAETAELQDIGAQKAFEIRTLRPDLT